MRRVLAAILLACVALAASDRGGSRAADEPLPFDMPSPDVLQASDRKVFGHYIPVFPISIDNLPEAEDYYTNGYLAPDGEGGIHSAYGGFIRSRPLPRPVNPAPDWELEDMRTEVEQAIQAGLDGFVVDVFGLEGFNWERVLLLLDAARLVDPDFDIVLAPGTNTGAVDDPVALADAVAGLADHPSAARDEIGRLVVAPFLAESVGDDYWRDWLDLMAERDVEVAFVPILLNYESSIDDFADFSAGVAAWGPRSVAGVDLLTAMGADAAVRGLLWMQPVAMQDARPRSSVFDEADNTETLRAMWAAADEVDASWIDVVTWNDYSEATQFAPNTNTGWSLLDINAYYLVAFKTGEAPPIVRDRLFVSHRIQPVDATPTGGQTETMELRDGSSPASDEVEVLTFLRTGATVDVTVGASSYTYDAPAGVHAELFPLEVGEISATSRAGDGSTASVTSPYPVTQDPVVQDLEYRVVGSGRDGRNEVVPVPPTAASTAASEDTEPAAVTPADDGGDDVSTTAAPGDTVPAAVAPADEGGGATWVVIAVAAAIVLAVIGGIAAARRTGRRPSVPLPDNAG